MFAFSILNSDSLLTIYMGNDVKTNGLQLTIILYEKGETLSF